MERVTNLVAGRSAFCLPVRTAGHRSALTRGGFISQLCAGEAATATDEATVNGPMRSAGDDAYESLACPGREVFE